MTRGILIAVAASAVVLTVSDGALAKDVLVLEISNPNHLTFDRYAAGRFLREAVEAQDSGDRVISAVELATTKELANCDSTNPVEIGRCLGASVVLATELRRLPTTIDPSRFRGLTANERLIMGTDQFAKRHSKARSGWSFSLTLVLYDVSSGERLADYPHSALCISADKFLTENAYQAVKGVLTQRRLKELMKDPSLAALTRCANAKKLGALPTNGSLQSNCGAEWRPAAAAFEDIESLMGWVAGHGVDAWKGVRWGLAKAAKGDLAP